MSALSARIARVVAPNMTDGDVDELVDASTARGTKEAKLRDYILRCRFPELVELIRNNIERAQLNELAQEVGLTTSERKQVIVERWLDHVGIRRPPVVEGAKSHIAQWRTEAQRFAAENQQKMAVTGRSREVAQRVGLRFERVLKELICFGCQLLGPGALEKAIARAEETEGRDAKTRFSGNTEAAVRWLFDQGLGTLRLVLGIVLKAARGEGKDCLSAMVGTRIEPVALVPITA